MRSAPPNIPCLEHGKATPASASVLVHGLLAGPRRPAVLVAAGPAATYLAAGDGLVAVVAAGAVRLPCAAVLAGDGPPPAGGDLAVGDHGVWDGDRPVAAVRRWFDPRVRTAPPHPGALARLAARVDDCAAPDPAVPAEAVRALAADPPAAVDGLVGRGGGLTPAGDDLVAGCLAALRARRHPAAGALGAAVRRRAPGRTTRLSAALLAAADRGAVVPEAAAVLRALTAPPGPGLDRAAGRLLGLGHTSGWYLAAGLAVGCAA